MSNDETLQHAITNGVVVTRELYDRLAASKVEQAPAALKKLAGFTPAVLDEMERDTREVYRDPEMFDNRWLAAKYYHLVLAVKAAIVPGPAS